ncbi:hypothetical protein G7046_g87 [Stylonectria norvegica]|nr:hypothetical protein G7046_g87 [Stylonectria norvegica]
MSALNSAPLPHKLQYSKSHTTRKMAQGQNTPPTYPPEFSFTFDDSVSEWNVPAQTWLTTKQKTWDAIACGAVVFDPQGRVLLVQRAAHDSLPNLWEVPGGAVDKEDATILFGCARELWEESGLVARHIAGVTSEGPGLAPGTVFPNRNGTRFFCKFSFVVEVDEGPVRLDPNEHQDWVWATEEEVTAEVQAGRKIPLTHPQMTRLVLEAFRLRRVKSDGVDEVVDGEREVKSS